ncbi:MAG: glycosyltransferase family 39 protein, partial [Planctomycetaceae bacterium]|nr:glycosyltransferase family 39 protein [Planctomycetaceae bacterium]
MPDAAAITPDEEASSGPVCGREWVALAVTVALGVWLRVAHSEHLAVEHFDEGVYAANWYCHPPGLPDGEFPRQYLYAPPLLPELCFWTLFASGSDPQSVMWINIVAGSLMIPLMWLVARQWFGVASGLIAAALCAFSDLHVALSRMVLTDVLLCLFLTAGVGAGVKAIVTGRLRWIAAAGILAALAWWTKYN